MFYEPRLKGSLNEYELDLLRQRSQEARRAKAERGELVITPPIGFVKNHDRLDLDPDKRVQEAIRLVFRKFKELGSCRQMLLWFHENELKFPCIRGGNAKRHVLWRKPNVGSLMRVLKHPVYAGAYVYGFSENVVTLENGIPKKRTRLKRKGEWDILIPNHHEGYITWDEYHRIQKTLANNTANFMTEKPGAAKRGPALLVGLLRCRRCGRKLSIDYTGARSRPYPRYTCRRGHLDYSEPKCIAFGGTTVDEIVSREVLRVVRPAAIEAAVAARQEWLSSEDDVAGNIRHELEAARFEADRAWRQFDAVDPANRLVADELERRYNKSLKRVGEAECRLQEQIAQRAQTAVPKVEEFRLLAEDLSRVWHDEQTDVRLKKRIFRTLIREIVVDIDDETSEVVLLVHWKGGVHTELRAHRRRRGETTKTTPPSTIEAIRVLALVCNDRQIAGYLNRNGLRTVKATRFTINSIVALRRRAKIASHNATRQQDEGWMNLTSAAEHVGISPRMLREAAERAEVPSKHPLPDGPWVFQRCDLDLPETRTLIHAIRQRCRRGGLQTSRQQPLLFKD